MTAGRAMPLDVARGAERVTEAAKASIDISGDLIAGSHAASLISSPGDVAPSVASEILTASGKEG